MKNKELIKNTALAKMYSTEHDGTRFSYLSGSEVETFGFFLWDWCEDFNVKETDFESILAFDLLKV